MADGPAIKYDISAGVTGAADVEKMAQEVEKLGTAFDPSVAARAAELSAQLRDLGAQNAAIQQFTQLQQRVTDAGHALTLAEANVREFAISLEAVTTPTKAQAGQLAKLNDAVTAAGAGLAKQREALDATRPALDALGISTDKLAQREIDVATATAAAKQEFANLAAEAQHTAAAGEKISAAWQTLGVRSFKDVQTEAAKVRASLADIQAVSKNPVEIKVATEAAQAKLKALSEEMTGTVGASADGLVTKFATIGATIAGIGFATKPIYDLAVQTETLRRVLTQTEGSVEGAEKQMEFLRSTAQRAGVSITDISQAFVRFNSAARSSGISGQVVNDVFEATTRAAGNLGLSSEKVTLILDALGQMASKGVVQMEELRGQLGDSLPGALGLMAKGLGLTQAELIKVVESGQLLTRDALPALASALAAVGGNGTQVEGLSASFNRLKNIVVEAGQSLIDGPAGSGAGLGLTVLGKIIETVAVIAVGFNQALGITAKTLALLAAALTGNIASFQQFKTEFAAILDDAASKVVKFEDHVASSGVAATRAGAQAAAAGQQVAAGAASYTQAAAAATAAAGAHEQAGTAATQSAGAHAAVATAATGAAAAQSTLATQTTAAGAAATTAGPSFAKLIVDYTTMTKTLEAQVSVSEKVVAAKKIEGEAAVAAVRVSGDAYAAMLAESAAADSNAQAQAALSIARNNEVAVLKAQIEAEKALSLQLGDPGGERQKQIDALTKTLALKAAEADSSNQSAKALQTESTSRALAVKAYGDNSAALGELKVAMEYARNEVGILQSEQARGLATQEQVNQGVERSSTAQKLYKDALDDSAAATARNIATMDADQHMVQAGITAQQAFYAALGRTAAARGDERAVTEASVRSKQLEIDAIESSVAAKNRELDATIANLKQQREAISATDPLIAQKQQEIDSRIKNAEAMKVENASRAESVTAILAETEALQRKSQAAAFANTEALDLSGVTAANKATKAASDASNAARKAQNSTPIDDSLKQSLADSYKAGTLSAADLANATANFQAQKANYTFATQSAGASLTPEARQDALAQYRIAQSILEKVTDLAKKAATPAATKPTTPVAAPAPVAAAPSVPKVGPSSVPAVGSTSHTVTVNIAGQSSTFSTASASDSDKVVAILKTLENAARSAGY